MAKKRRKKKRDTRPIGIDGLWENRTKDLMEGKADLGFFGRVTEWLDEQMKPSHPRKINFKENEVGEGKRCVICGKPIRTGRKYCHLHRGWSPEQQPIERNNSQLILLGLVILFMIFGAAFLISQAQQGKLQTDNSQTDVGSVDSGNGASNNIQNTQDSLYDRYLQKCEEDGFEKTYQYELDKCKSKYFPDESNPEVSCKNFVLDSWGELTCKGYARYYESISTVL